MQEALQIKHRIRRVRDCSRLPTLFTVVHCSRLLASGQQLGRRGHAELLPQLVQWLVPAVLPVDGEQEARLPTGPHRPRQALGAKPLTVSAGHATRNLPVR